MSDLALFDSYDDADDSEDDGAVDRTPTNLPDGVYLDLPPHVYFAQKGRLGSSDIWTLHSKREGWWWQSEHCTLKARLLSTTAQNYGSALHVILLEGVPTYEARFMVAPDQSDYPGLLVTEPDIKAALVKAGADMTGTSKFKKADWVAKALVDLPDANLWDAIDAAFKKAQVVTYADGHTEVRPSVTSVEDRLLRIMLDAALDADTEEGREIAQLLVDPDHPPLAEVTVLWTDSRGIRRRGRLDRLWPKFTLDLKSLRGSWNGRDLTVTADDMIKKNGYDVQRADHHEARRYLYAFIQMGIDEYVHGGDSAARAWLATFPDIAPRWDYVWLFYQKPDMTAGDAPVIFPLWDEHKSTYHVRGVRKQQRALDFYTAQVARYGLDKPWSRVMGLHYTDPDLKPNILAYPDNHPSASEPYPNEDALLGD